MEKGREKGRGYGGSAEATLSGNTGAGALRGVCRFSNNPGRMIVEATEYGST